MKKLFTTALLLTGTLSATEQETQQTANYTHYRNAAESKQNQNFEERLKGGFERRPSVADFRKLEAENNNLPNQPKKTGDATKILDKMYQDALNDLMDFIGWDESKRESKKRHPNLSKDIILKVAEQYNLSKTFFEITFDGTPSRVTYTPFSLEDRAVDDREQNISKAEKIKKLTDFKIAVILAHADMGIDLRDPK